ncbi:restriction endonuclease subunit S [Brevibacillus gelatini]|uniref:restriction endonuclease subunit S n=1 Tax=Brevibacillus gelatini TaxID=1655277 RepID=UPI003D81B144
MTEIDKKPEIRFICFFNDWEQRKVGEIVTDVERPIILKDDEVYQLVTVKRRNEGVVSRGFLKGRDILVKNYFEIRTGDYIISKRQVIHGANGLVPEHLDKSVVSNEYLVVVSNDIISSKFWALISKRHDMYRMFLLSSYGVDIEKMVFNIDDWKKRTLIIPSKSEQNRIIEFFERLDNLITLHQCKYDKLVNFKKSMLGKMFPKDGANVPEFRFAGFNDAWEQRKLGSIATSTYGGGTPATSNEEYWNGNIPWIQSSDLTEDEVFGVSPRKYISEAGLRNSATKLIPEDSIAIITRVGVGKLAIIPFAYTTSQDFLSLSGLNIDPWFGVYACYKKLQSELHKVQGTSIKGITKNELLEKSIFVPISEDEQKKIGNFFKVLDNLINLQKRKLNKLKNIKKTMLEKMFV